LSEGERQTEKRRVGEDLAQRERERERERERLG
jgi:hypothetical protein